VNCPVPSLPLASSTVESSHTERRAPAARAAAPYADAPSYWRENTEVILSMGCWQRPASAVRVDFCRPAASVGRRPARTAHSAAAALAAGAHCESAETAGTAPAVWSRPKAVHPESLCATSCADGPWHQASLRWTSQGGASLPLGYAARSSGPDRPARVLIAWRSSVPDGPAGNPPGCPHDASACLRVCGRQGCGEEASVALVCPGTAPVLGKAGDHRPCLSWDILCVSEQP
jgi:hypothetical protein